MEVKERVYLNDDGRPFYIKRIADEIWLYLWNIERNQWVALKKIMPGEASRLPDNLPASDQALYLQGIRSPAAEGLVCIECKSSAD